MGYNPRFRGNSTSPAAETVGGSIDNNSGSSLLKATPVRIDGNGDAQFVDVSVESEALATVGVTVQNVLNGTTGQVATSGRVKNITTTANNGDSLYVSKTGGLTNTQPSIGAGGFIAGDFIIRIGTLLKNEENPAQQDLLLNVDIIGQL